MRTQPVRWSDGMLMMPHHFQAADAYVFEHVGTSQSWQSPDGYGLHSIEINTEALSNFEVRIPTLRARLKDGTLVSVPENAHLDTLDLQSAMEDSAEVYLHLVLPELVAGQPNSSPDSDDGKCRYLVSTGEWDEINDGGNPQKIETHRLNPRIVARAGRDAPQGYESVPIAKLKRSQQSEAPPEIDMTYIPPLLNCGCWKGLKEDILATICSQLGSYIKAQAEHLRIHGGWSEANQPQIRRAIAQLDASNTSYPVLVQLSQARGIHPQAAYFELCRLIGRLAILREDWHPPEMPLYDHDNLGSIFQTAKEEIEGTLKSEGLRSKVQRFPLNNVGDWMEVSLAPEWMQGGREFFIGVRSELSPERLEQLFSRRWLDWKLGSSRTITQIYANAEAGLKLKRLVGVHETLPVLQHLTYFKIDPRGSYWEQVIDSRALALMVNERYIQRKSVGQSTFTVVDPKNNPRDLGLELFVIEND